MTGISSTHLVSELFTWKKCEKCVIVIQQNFLKSYFNFTWICVCVFSALFYLSSDIKKINGFYFPNVIMYFCSRSSHKPAPRLFCDICDVFDLHDTEDCPQQAMSDSPPPSLHHRDRHEQRPYCDICEGKRGPYNWEKICHRVLETFIMV